jgi:hypothetical protein
MLRDGIARALPALDEGISGLHSVLGMHAFGLENRRLRPRRGRGLPGCRARAVRQLVPPRLRPRARDAEPVGRDNRLYAHHPVAWVTDRFFKVYNLWHFALYRLEMENHNVSLILFGNGTTAGYFAILIDTVDASALLRRLYPAASTSFFGGLRGLGADAEIRRVRLPATPCRERNRDRIVCMRRDGHAGLRSSPSNGSSVAIAR